MLDDTTSSPIPDAPASVVPRTLDRFVEAVSRAEGVGLTDVEVFTTLVVQTDHSVYQITVLQPHTRQVVVQGGAFFPDRRLACLSGSSFGSSCLKLGWGSVCGWSCTPRTSGSSRRRCDPWRWNRWRHSNRARRDEASETSFRSSLRPFWSFGSGRALVARV